MDPRCTESSIATAPVSLRVVEAARLGLHGEVRLALLVRHAGGAELFPLGPDASVVIGRDAPAQVRIPDIGLSREHARFTLSGGVVVVEDLRSTNGTWLRGDRVKRAELKPGDEVVLGRVVACVRMLSPDDDAVHACSQEGRSVEPVVASAAMRSVFASVGRLARSVFPVLLQGETGTGKEVVARAIHDQSARRSRPMVCVNCGAIPQQLVESTLFGHERGAFTGASQQQKGVFEAADGGTVFLDEIGELPLAAQVALLRVLETKRVTRVGASREIEVDMRLVAATHRDLEAMCEKGEFRVDLLFRLNAMTLVIPPLRARPDDIEPLALRFLAEANASNGRSLRGITPEALGLLKGYAWPGNVRELRNVVERAVVFADGEWISELDLPERVSTPAAAPAESAAERATPIPAGAGATAPEGHGDLRTRLQQYEVELILQALRDADWNQTEAARRLGMPLRTLVHKLKVYGLKKLGYAPAEDGHPAHAKNAGR